MESLIIHNLDRELAIAIEGIAESTGLSPRKVVESILRKALKLERKDEPARDLSPFFGVWNQEEEKEFNEANKIFEQIDEKMWQ